jgi:NAD(P)-dependent dehydrogenase (short-subunit alcohol dehydrogenase family)
MTQRLNGKTAAITGGGGGIGSASGRIFCAEGARVALIDQSEHAVRAAVEKIREELPGAAIDGYVADLGHEDEANRVISEITARFGRLDILVNNVGIRRYEAIADAPWETWDEIIRVNLLSFAAMARAALPHLRSTGAGSVKRNLKLIQLRTQTQS